MSIEPHPPTGWAAEIRATLALTWPLVLTNLGQIAIGTTDTLMMGWLGPGELAAGTLGANLYFAVFIFGLGLVQATAPMFAQGFGRKRHAVRESRRILRQGLWAALAFCLPVWALLWRAEDLLLLMGQEPRLAAQAQDYVRWLQWSLLPALWFTVMRSFLAALERPAPAMAVMAGGVAFNILSNWLLMFGNWGFPKLGLAGAGISSTLAFTGMTAVLAGFLVCRRPYRRFYLLGHWWRPDWPKLKELLRLGAPMALMFGFEVTVFNAAAFMMGLIGAEQLAAHAIALQIASVTFMVPLGIGQAATVRVGLAAGAGDRAGIRLAGWVALALGIGFMAAMALLLMSRPAALAGLFLDLSDPAAAPVLAHAVTFLTMAALFQVVDGAQSVGGGVLRGLKDTRVPMLYAGLGYWGIGMPLGAALAFAAGLGGLGIWIGLALGLAVVAALMLLRWIRRERLGLA